MLYSDKIEILTVDATMSTVGAAPLLRGTIALYVHHVEGVDVEPLALNRDVTGVRKHRAMEGVTGDT